MLLPETVKFTSVYVCILGAGCHARSLSFYTLSREASIKGRKAGIISVLGIASGDLVHIIAAALGISALLLSSALAFNIVKYLGAAYLIYLGIRKLGDRSHLQLTSTQPPESLRRIFLQGFVVNALNPKPALFFMAFFAAVY